MRFLGCKSCHREGMKYKRVSTVVIAAGLIVGGCSGSSTSDEPTEEELAGEVVSEEPETTEAATTTTSSTSTVPPTTTTTTPPVTTTTMDPVERGVVSQFVAMTYIRDGDPQGDEVRNQIITIADGLVGVLGRVDVVTAEVSDDVGVRLVVEALSGYSTQEYQCEEAADFLYEFARLLWTPEGVGNILPSGAGGVDFDFTMDGRNWVIPAQTMLDIVARRTSAQAALGF